MGSLAGSDNKQAEAGTSLLSCALNPFVHRGTEELVIHFIPFPKLNGLIRFNIPPRSRFLRNKAATARDFLRRDCVNPEVWELPMAPSPGCSS